MAALALVDPADVAGLDVEDEYLLGPDLLVAPVLADRARTRVLHAPPGDWVDLWRVAAYDAATRELVPAGGAHPLRGPGPHEVPAPLDEIPILVRAGAVLPLLSADVDSLAPYRAPGVVNAADREGVRRLLCFPAVGAWHGAVGPGEPMASIVADGVWDLDLAGGGRRRYEVRADLGLLVGGPPARVAVDGASGPVRYDAARGLLAAEADGPVLRVRLGRP
jgi:hypothetical protein